MTMYRTTEKDQLVRSIGAIHQRLDTVYHKLFDEIGDIQSQVQTAARIVTQVQERVQEYRRKMPDFYAEIQSLLQAAEIRADALDEVEDMDRDSIDSALEDIRSHMLEIESELTNITDALPSND